MLRLAGGQHTLRIYARDGAFGLSVLTDTGDLTFTDGDFVPYQPDAHGWTIGR